MWTHLIQIMRARRAVRAGRYESALVLLDDPLIREERRAQELRRRVAEGMLARVRQRIRTGHLELAAQDLGRLEEVDPDLPGRAELAGELGSIRALSDERRDQEAALVRGFERAFDEGRLGEAREFLASLEDRLDRPSFDALRKRLADRRKQASAALRLVRESLDRGLEREAREAMDRARRLCADSITFRERLVGLSAAWAKERWARVQHALAGGRTLDAARALADWWESDPDSDDLVEGRDLLLCVTDRLAEEARGLATQGRFQEALQLVCRAPRPVTRVHAFRRLRERLEQLDLLLSATGEDPRRRARGLAGLFAETGWPALEAELDAARRAAAELDRGLEEARALLLSGEPEAGKGRLEAILAKWPGCDEAKALLDGLIDDERERAEQLKAARQAVRDGRLLAAQRHLFRLVTGGHGADEARSLLRDVERLRAKVSREADGLLARLEAGEGPDEILARVARLERDQRDSPELADLEAVALRLRARTEREARIRAALAERDCAGCLAALREWIAEGGDDFRREERGRLAVLGAEIAAELQGELGRGDPAFVCELASGLRTWQDLLGVDLGPLLAEATKRVSRARGLAREGLDLLEQKHVTAAGEALEKARVLSPREPQVLRLAHRLGHVARERKELEEALDLAATDREGAKEKLASLGPTPRPLGSLVLRVKQEVERSGDLETGCLLQVEEAGEFLVFPDDRLRVGNATGRSFPQLRILAKIKAHHATFVRHVSFHGGVQDSVEPAGGGDVEVNGSAPAARLKNGDRILLGGVLPFVYLRPSPRSSSALLRIEKGFECRGTTRVLWVKQGGRDGRVFVGRGREVHVRVPHAEPELYLFAPGGGRLCVHFDGPGAIDGEEFTGDRTLDPGAAVACGAIRFRVLPL